MPTELDRRLASGDVPHVLQGVLLPFAWRLERLRRLELPSTEIRVNDFAWMLDLPLWRDGDEWFAVSPHGVSREPHRFAAQWRRTRDADIAYPVVVTQLGDRRVIIDGIHRLLRAEMERIDVLPAAVLPASRWSAIKA